MGLDVLYLLIPITLILAGIALGLFVWAIHAGQFDDLETPAIRILFEDSAPPAESGAPGTDVPDRPRADPSAPGSVYPPGKRTE